MILQVSDAERYPGPKKNRLEYTALPIETLVLSSRAVPEPLATHVDLSKSTGRGDRCAWTMLSPIKTEEQTSALVIKEAIQLIF
ncbi:hypothetical protein RIVM261_080830 [Rivularia sp. IAM M-261]|nr:hypothetical protein CAL7716_016230 [Calothrix sp. PCC 7716]GJD23127.1 hypothetical protein RIVM261_080830 [Rivularia sp. IAM M-261]